MAPKIFPVSLEILILVSVSTVALFLLQLPTCTCNSIEQELTLTHEEKLALDKFKQEVEKVVPHDYMKEDIYLIKWLRSRNLDVEKAKKMLFKNLKWREEYGMDGIVDEDFSYFVKRFPFWLDGRDKDDRPVGSADISAWDPRAVVIAGRGNDLLRYILRVVEMGARLVRTDQKNGRNVTQFTLLGNLDGFNLIQHGCLQCIPIYLQYLTIYENFYPGLLHKLFLINTPSSFDVLLRIVKPVLAKETSDALSIHGKNKNNWREAVLELIDADQIRPQFGGTRPIDTDAENFWSPENEVY